ncbi:MAG TPA: fatty acid-binding protein DegV [Bacteroidales bacterium]|nr:fatty acid-binding protein DegV [Bacteroidales bacterium]
MNKLALIDGRNLYYAFKAGAGKIIDHQTEINKLNVFPVSDHDTGTNLASTIRSILENWLPDRSYKISVNAMAEAAMYGARGNSGIIFAQFLYGVSAETTNTGKISIAEFAQSLKSSIKYMYEAMSNPVEGTMLSVIRDWADYIYENRHATDFKQLLIESLETAKKSLENTKNQLQVLATNNVVDAGGKGFVLFVEGIIELLKTNNVRSLSNYSASAIQLDELHEHDDEVITHRYCTEALIKNCHADKTHIANILNQFGNSIVVAGSDKLRRIHVHTNTPAELFQKLKNVGTLSFQKAEDMVRQHDAAYNRKWNIALLTDSTCDLTDELIDKYQIQMLPIGIQFGESMYLDNITLKSETFFEMFGKETKNPSTTQINQKAFENVYSHLASHYDAIIAVHISDQLSGTCGNSAKAAQKISAEFNKPITVINSKSLSGMLGLVLVDIAKNIEFGLPYEKIIELAQQRIQKSRIYVSVKTLKYMVRGGRVSPLKGFIAKLLNLKPIISVDENGKAINYDKTFSQRANLKKIMSHVKEFSKNGEIEEYIITHAANPKGVAFIKTKLVELTGKEPLLVTNISPAIGINAGLGAVSVSVTLK